MRRYQHWKNLASGGHTAFVTTTALDFVPVFAGSDAKDRMAHLLITDHERYGAALLAFVIMQNHIHFLTRLPENRDVSWLVQRIKANSARHLKPRLAPEQASALADQTGLNGRTFWQRSFRSVTVEGEEMFWQKVDYIHMNAVKAGLAETPQGYRWSSASLFLAGQWDESRGVTWERWTGVLKSVHSGAVEA